MAGRRLRKRWKWVLTGAVMLPVGIVAVAPYLAAVPPFRNTVLRAVFPEVNGTVTAEGASLGWFSPIHYEQIEIRSKDETRVVSIAAFDGDKTLVSLLLDASDLGTLRLEQPRLDVVVSESGSNLEEVFRKSTGSPRKTAPSLAARLQIVDGGLTFQGPKSPQPWRIDGVNISLGLEPGSPTDGGQPELFVEAGKVFDRTPVTPQMCDDLLEYIAPILAQVADADGTFSIELDEWRVPLDDFDRGQGSGRFTIHSFDVGPGPLARGLASLLDLPASVRLADETVVQFEMADGRVYHRDFEFGLGPLRVRTRGSVGVDRTLDLIAEVPVPSELLGEGELTRVLARQALVLPVKGTLDEPKIDAKALRQNLFGNLADIISDPSLDPVEVLERLKEEGALKAGKLRDKLLNDRPLLEKLREGPPPPGIPFLKRLRERRERRRPPEPPPVEDGS